MAVAVVDELEVVEVDQQARERPAGARGAADLLVQAAAHRAVVHAAGDRVGAGLGARAHERERRRRLLDERPRELDRALVEGPPTPAHEHHDRLDLAALGERQQQRAAHLAGRRQPRHARGELAVVGREEALARCSPPS